MKSSMPLLRNGPAHLIILSLFVAEMPSALAQTTSPVTATAVNTNWARGTGSKMEGKTHVERAIGTCAVSVIGGAVLGTILGAAAGKAKTGALIGTGLGIGACAIIMKIASKQDKLALRNTQLLAANSGMFQNSSWVSKEGANLNATVKPSAAVPLVVGSNGSYRCRTDDRCLVGDTWVPYQTLVQASPENASVKLASYQPQVFKCRRLDTRVDVDGRTASSGSDVVCLVGDTWVTGDKLKKMNIRDEDIVVT